MPGILDWLQQKLGGPGDDDPAASWQAMNPAGATPYTQQSVLPYLQDVITGQNAKQGMQNLFGADQRDLGTALAFSGLAAGGLGVKGTPRPRAAAASDLPAPNIGMGTEAPLFDYSRLTERPNVPQVPIERMPEPPKGVPEWAKTQIADPAMREQYLAVLRKGQEVGGKQNTLGWWNTFPLRDRAMEYLGEAAGDARWRSGMGMWSAASPRTEFPQTIRQASYFENLLAEGKPLPELYKKYQTKNPNAYNMAPVESGPPGYKNFPAHIQNIENLLQPNGLLGGTYPLTNPKPATMRENLLGNWLQPTIDVRDLRAMSLKDKSGEVLQSVDPASLYGYIEKNFHQPLAEKIGIDPAQMQSSTWVGVPEFFGGFDRSGTNSALGTLEDSLRRTAKALGMTPEQALNRGYFNKEFKLLGAGAGIGLPGLLGNGIDENKRAAVK